jgi:hypothetical protein
MHDPIEIDHAEQTARFRSVCMPIHVLRILLDGAERQHSAGRLRGFVEAELTDVVTRYGNQPVAASLVGVDEEVCWYFQNHWHRIRLAADDARGEVAR